MRIYPEHELHTAGGPGQFYLSRTEDFLDTYMAEYEGRVQMIYLDPPFGTGDTFHVRSTRGPRAVKLPAFDDKLSQKAYLAWMRRVLEGCHRLLSDEGSLYLHIDYRMDAYLRLMLDEVFGSRNFMNEIIWCYKSGGRSVKYFPRKHDTILFYRKSPRVYFNIAAVGKPRGPEKRNHMKRYIDEDGRICFSIRSGGKTYTYYEDTPMYPTDVWNDIEHLQQKDRERVGYATQKPEALLERMIRASSRPGDLVADLFSGSGTTAAAASKLARRYLAVDGSPFALYTLRARQIKNAGARSFLDGSHQMRLSFPADACDAALECEKACEDGRVSVRVSKAHIDPDHPLVYAALGTAEADTFCPRAVSLRPDLPLRLSANECDEPVVQIVDALGHTAFFRV